MWPVAGAFKLCPALDVEPSLLGWSVPDDSRQEQQGELRSTQGGPWPTIANLANVLAIMSSIQAVGRGHLRDSCSFVTDYTA